MKKRAMMAAFICLTAMLTACGQTENVTEQTDGGAVIGEEAESAAETPADEAPADAEDGESDDQGSSGKKKIDKAAAEKFYEKHEPTGELINPDVTMYGDSNVKSLGLRLLANVTINGIKLHLEDGRVDQLVKDANLTQDPECLFYNPIEEGDADDGIFWYGRGYGLTSEDGTISGDSRVFIEGGHYNGVCMEEVDLNLEGGYYLRSVYANLNMLEDETMVTFFGGIHCGNTRQEVEEIFKSLDPEKCAGNVSKGYTYYSDVQNTLMIRYNEDDIAEEIYLFCDDFSVGSTGYRLTKWETQTEAAE